MHIYFFTFPYNILFWRQPAGGAGGRLTANCLTGILYSNTHKKAALEEKKKKQNIKRCHTLRDRTNEAGNEWTCILKHQLAQLEHNGLHKKWVTHQVGCGSPTGVAGINTKNY